MAGEIGASRTTASIRSIDSLMLPWREANTVRGVNTVDELQEALDGGAGFVFTGWSGDPAVEETVKNRMKATIRVLPGEAFQSDSTPVKCVSGEGNSATEVAWARAY